MTNVHQLIDEGNLHKWFSGSKSKDGKKGWVNVVTGGTCASDKPGEGTPKCVSSSKRASMTKAERLSASRRKKKADPGQQSKSGAAKPTYVSTDKPKKKMKEETQISEADKKGKGSGKKDACYHKVKASASVWPSAYASGRLVQCRKKGAANYGNSKKESYSWRKSLELDEAERSIDDRLDRKNKLMKKTTRKAMDFARDEGEASGHARFNMSRLGREREKLIAKKVKKEEVISERQKDSDGQRLSQERGRSNYGKASVRNMRASGTGGNAADPAERLVAMDARHKAHKEKRGVKKEEKAFNQFYNECWKTHKKVGMKMKGGKLVPDCRPKNEETHVYWSSKALDQLEKIQEKSAAWQRKEGKNKTGGLNEKGRKSYERENPGSDLKAPQPGGGPRKRSFCARMSGVKGPMKDEKGRPTRKALALRKWKC